MLKDISKYNFYGRSQFVRLRGKYTAQCTHCALGIGQALKLLLADGCVVQSVSTHLSVSKAWLTGAGWGKGGRRETQGTCWRPRANHAATVAQTKTILHICHVCHFFIGKICFEKWVNRDKTHWRWGIFCKPALDKKGGFQFHSRTVCRESLLYISATFQLSSMHCQPSIM